MPQDSRHAVSAGITLSAKVSARAAAASLSSAWWQKAESYLIAGAHISLGPSQDSPQLRPALKEAASHRRFDRLLADAAYDAEHNPVLARQTLGIRSTVIPINRRNHGRK